MSDRHRDLLLTAVMLGVGLTPAWLLPTWLSLPWQLAFLLLAPPALWYSWRHAPWQPTPRSERARILHHLDLQPGERFCDLGAGDGRVLLWVHKATGADCTGLEASPLQWAVARLRLARHPGARVHLADLYRSDLKPYDALYVWGTAYSVGTSRFAEHMRAQLRPGARLLSYHHPLPGMQPTAVDEAGQRPIYVYHL